MDSVISNPDVASIYQVPQVLYDGGILRPLSGHMGLRIKKTDLSGWKRVACRGSSTSTV